MTTSLSVNLNAIAHLRNRRDLPWPSLTGLARICLDAGAAGITVHPRPDERHIRTGDLYELNATLHDPDFEDAQFTMAGYPDERFLKLCEGIKPNQVILAPDMMAASEPGLGWNVLDNYGMLAEVCRRLHGVGAQVTLLINADPEQADPAERVGSDRVELNTGPYGQTFEPGKKAAELEKLVAAAKAADEAGLGVNAGHNLTIDNLPPLVAAAPMITEVSIGHGLFADALTYGYA